LHPGTTAVSEYVPGPDAAGAVFELVVEPGAEAPHVVGAVTDRGFESLIPAAFFARTK
jgi:hypothetical protein